MMGRSAPSSPFRARALRLQDEPLVLQGKTHVRLLNLPTAMISMSSFNPGWVPSTVQICVDLVTSVS
jgi:hypothetical protein